MAEVPRPSPGGDAAGSIYIDPEALTFKSTVFWARVVQWVGGGSRSVPAINVAHAVGDGRVYVPREALDRRQACEDEAHVPVPGLPSEHKRARKAGRNVSEKKKRKKKKKKKNVSGGV